MVGAVVLLSIGLLWIALSGVCSIGMWRGLAPGAGVIAWAFFSIPGAGFCVEGWLRLRRTRKARRAGAPDDGLQ